MRLDEQHIFQSKYHKIKLIATEFDEPHPGRTIWRFKFYVNDQLAENQYLNYKWSGLYPNLDEFELESEDGNFMFIPAENPILYDVKENKYHPVAITMTINGDSFVKNKFSENRLIVIRQSSLQLINLSTFNAQTIAFTFGKYQLLDAYYIDDILIVKYKDLNNFETYTKRYDFEKMDFEQ